MRALDRIVGGWRKRRAIAAYLRRLPGQLRRDYGPADHYTPAQIRASISRAGLDRGHSCYAVAWYAEPEAFAADHAARGEVCDYEAMRADVAASHSGGHGAATFGEASGMAGPHGAGSEAFGHHGALGHGGASDGGHGGW